MHTRNTEHSDSTSHAAFRGHLTVALEREANAPVGGLADALRDLLRSAPASLPVLPARHRDLWAAGTGHADAVTVHDILTRAEDDLGTPWGVPLASAAARVHRDGNRDEWEGTVFARQRRLSRAVVTAAVTLQDRWIDEVADGVVLLCEQSSWCWPAHDDTMGSHGAILATITDPFLDLGAGEVAAQLAWIDHLLGTQLDVRYPGLRARIRHETRTRVLDPFVLRRDWHWLGLDGDVHNWNPWIHGNVLVAALRLMDAPAERDDRARVVALAVEGLDRYVTSLPADGAIDEGYAYWWNGACRALEALDLLSFATRGVLEVTASIPALRETVAFPHRMHLGGDWYLNLADGQARPPRDQPWHSLHRAARRVGDSFAEAHAAAHRDPERPAASETEGLGRLLRGITDPEWLRAVPAPSPLPRDVWLPSTQVLVARENEGVCDGLAVAAKGGHNAEHHNHNDVGSFIVASDGVPVIVDAGRPTYTLATFGAERYSIWTMQSSWHNVPEIRGVPQPAGAEARASDVVVHVDEHSTSLGLDLAAAYPVPGLVTWRRDIHLDRGLSKIVVDDRWTLEPWGNGSPAASSPEPRTTVRMLLAGEVQLDDGSALVIPVDGAPAVRLRWPTGVAATLVPRPLDDPLLSDVWGSHLTRLDLDVTDRNSLSVTVEMNEPKARNPR
ncbi:heparinase II/III-like protein [Glaciihabitans tibetensis]|uniref:Heparinase II/III-like protein n=1 Tax=Glaciihabitans tibetensis TaxID=1266600 RepID=A0A2T0VE30_9MICO|nr:heparinase II/III family protein [Glaciihabitans tibetensis]PRY68418.1 heparinase II/III-like protein [Glaciihabitans tibetensis]